MEQGLKDKITSEIFDISLIREKIKEDYQSTDYKLYLKQYTLFSLLQEKPTQKNSKVNK